MTIFTGELADECSELREQLSAVEKLATDGLICTCINILLLTLAWWTLLNKYCFSKWKTDIPSILRLAERINGGHLNIDVSQVVASNERDARFWNKYHFSYPIKSAKQLKMLNDLIGINREFYEDVVSFHINGMQFDALLSLYFSFCETERMDHRHLRQSNQRYG